MQSKPFIHFVPFQNPSTAFSAFSSRGSAAGTDNLAAQMGAGMLLVDAPVLTHGPIAIAVPTKAVAPLSAAERAANVDIANLLGAEEADSSALPDDRVRKLWR